MVLKKINVATIWFCKKETEVTLYQTSVCLYTVRTIKIGRRHFCITLVFLMLLKSQ